MRQRELRLRRDDLREQITRGQILRQTKLAEPLGIEPDDLRI